MKRAFEDTGSAVLEFLGGALVLLVPCVYAVLCFGSVEAATLSVEGAARNAARLFIDQHSSVAGSAVATRAVREALSDVPGLTQDTQVRTSCQPRCEGAGGLVTISVRARIELPLLPQWPATRFLTTVPIVASASQTSARFGASP